MRNLAVFAFAIALTAAPSGAIVDVDGTVTWTGWFSDAGCARSKVESGNISPNGTDCVKRCLSEGATPVFLSEQTKAMYEVKDHRGVMEDVGYHLELTGVVDENAKTISVRSVTRLSEVVQTCALPKKKSK